MNVFLKFFRPLDRYVAFLDLWTLCVVSCTSKCQCLSFTLQVMNLIGDVKGKVAVMVDDMIDTAGEKLWIPLDVKMYNSYF